MTQEALEQLIVAAHQRLENLLERASQVEERSPTQDNSTTLLQEAIAELTDTLEELQVVAEELQQQNEALSATHESLAAERHRYQDLFNFAPDSYLVTDVTGLIQEVNDAAAQLLHVTPSYLRGKPLSVFVHPVERQKLRWMMFQMQQEETIQRQELRMFHAEGRIDFTAELAAVAIRDRGGNLIGFRWVIRDINPCKQTREALQVSEAKLSAILENAIAVIASVRIFPNRNWEYEYISSGSEALFGYTAQEMQAQKSIWISRIVPEDLNACLAPLLADIFTECPVTVEYRFQHKDGKQRWISTTFRSRRDETADCWNVTAVATDISDRKHLEIALQASETKLNDILNSAIAAIVCFRVFADRDWEYEYMSSGSEAVFDFTPAELMADKMLWRSRVFPEDLEMVLMRLYEGVFAERTTTIEYRVRHQDGSVRWISGTYASRRDEAANCWIVTGVGQDISVQQAALHECQRAELAVQESEARYRTICELTSDYIYSCSVTPEGTILDEWATPNLSRITGYTFEQLPKGENGWLNVVYPDDLPALSQFIAQLIATHQPGELDYRIITQQGEIRWICDRIHPIWDETQGRVVRLLGAVEDITERKQAEAALQKSEEHLRLALDLTYIGSWDWNITTGELIWNDNHYRLMGLVPGEIQPSYQVWCDRVHPEDIDRIEQARLQALETHTDYEAEYRTIHPDGSVRWLQARGRGLYNAEGQAVRMLGVLFDISDRKQTEIALQQSEARFRQLAETIDEVFYIAAPGCSQMLYISPAYQKIWGRSCEILYQQPRSWLEALHPEDSERVLAAFSAHVQGERLQEEYRIIRPDGEIRWIFDRNFPVYSATGELLYVVGLAEDISDRKQAEAELRQSQQRLQLVLDATTDGIWDWNVINNQLLWSHQIYEFLGLNPSTEASYETFYNLVHPDDRERLTQRIQIHLECDRPYEIEMRIQRADGSYGWFLSKGKAIRDAAGRPVRMIGSCSDISSRKGAEQKIREQAALLDVTTDAILVRDLNNQILYWNQGAQRLYGWNAEEACGNNAWELLFPDVSPQLETALKTVVECGSWQGELQKVTKDGKGVIVESRWTLMRDEAGQPKSILTVDTDITEKKQLQAQFLRAQRLESLGTLASGIAHDLNNILTPILVAAQLLPIKLPDLDERNQQMLKMLENNAKRGADLVKQILSFARGTEGKRTLMQLKNLLADIEHIARQTFSKSIEIETNVPADLWTVCADTTQLHQVLMNLCVNARDAMPNGGTLSLSAANLSIDESYARMNIEAKVGPYVKITVADTGIGIPPDIIDRVFDPFFTTKEVGKGTGLGLSTVLGIVKSYGGFVEVSSEVGIGSQFIIYLPASEGIQTPIAAELEQLVGNGELILVTEDEIAIREITKTTLESHNYRVLTANDGIEAIAVYAEHLNEIRLVLMDIMMPSMDGLIAIRTLQRINPQVKIIAMSGLTSTDAIAQATDIGIQDFLPKPFTAQELLNAVRTVVGSR